MSQETAASLPALNPLRFLWIDLQLKALCAQSDSDFLDVLQRLPRGLDKKYDRVLQQIHEQPEQLQKLARKCLMWGFYAIRPLTITELQHVVAIEWPESKKAPPIYEAEVIFESCSNLLMEESGRVRPIHYSVREFFTKPLAVGISPTYKDWVFEFKASKCQLAVACLACLKKAEIAVRQYDLHYLLRSCGGLIACFLTSREGHARIVQLLLDNNGDPNLSSGKYGSALQAAIVWWTWTYITNPA